MPRNLRRSETLWGAFILVMAEVFSGSARIPLTSTTWPRNLTDALPNSHLSGLRVTPVAASHSMTVVNRVSCSFASVPKMRTSSIMHTTPRRPSNTSLMRFWKSSGVLDIPKGSFLKQTSPNGVMNVVRCCDSGANGICQKSLFASSLLKILPPASWARVSSTFRMGCTSRRTLSLSGFKSTQMRIAPDRFGTTTIPARTRMWAR